MGQWFKYTIETDRDYVKVMRVVGDRVIAYCQDGFAYDEYFFRGKDLSQLKYLEEISEEEAFLKLL